MFPALRAIARDPEGKVLLVAFVSVVGVGTVAYMLLEHWSLLDSLYFCIVTLATVGFGDLHPTTDASKAFTIVYILAGIGVLTAFVSELTRYRHPRIADRIGPALGEPDPSAPPAEGPGPAGPG
jgi:Ion channel